jgi:ParB family chromosome partitioning protein
MIDEALEDLATRGRFDVVICDSVVNSVDTVQAETDVLTCLAAFCKPGGRVFFCGRSSSREMFAHIATKTVDERNYLYFPDKNGLSAKFRDGHWFYQKFHTPEQVRDLARRFFGSPPDHVWSPKSSDTWQVSTVNAGDRGEAEIVAALSREFDLPWPGGKSVGRSAQAVAAWRAALELERSPG